LTRERLLQAPSPSTGEDGALRRSGGGPVTFRSKLFVCRSLRGPVRDLPDLARIVEKDWVSKEDL
jgi:hypothetical protein